MNYAVFNPDTKQVTTIAVKPVGALPEGFEFVPENELPVDAMRVVNENEKGPVTKKEISLMLIDEKGQNVEMMLGEFKKLLV